MDMSCCSASKKRSGEAMTSITGDSKKMANLHAWRDRATLRLDLSHLRACVTIVYDPGSM